ncbi:hypothetical protein IP92_04849 [Pseudoduganella flava]|uniref:AraC family transcriptional regulator n=1 Tax=Pseudoduganella flava TaxID=871742 RepID=A0A562PH57_9BURK|nr:hypothetical protein [Pseudoduganella flava]QGZ42638.1 hypothetical protein GO485_28780 [Pseudoduganella flava]TWI43795.1 hypothetical protein IP92_04849 [Pseudoduganella flava]
MALVTPADAAALAVAGLTLAAALLSLVQVGRRVAPGHARTWLMLVLAAAALLPLGDFVRHLHWNAAARWIAPFADAALLVLGPATWSYASSLVDGSVSVRRRWRHLLPALAFLLMLLLVALEQPPKEDRAVWRSLAELMILAPIVVQMAGYGLALATFVSRVRAALRRRGEGAGTGTRPVLRWLQVLFVLYGVLLVAAMATWPWPLAWANVVTNLIVAAAIAWAGSNGVRQVPLAVTPEELAATEDDAAA